MNSETDSYPIAKAKQAFDNSLRLAIVKGIDKNLSKPAMLEIIQHWERHLASEIAAQQLRQADL